MNDITAPIIADSGPEPEFEVGSDTFDVSVGQWYWVLATRKNKDNTVEDARWLGCCIHVGSNYLEIKSPPSPQGGYSSTRIHFDDFWTSLLYEPDHARILAEKVAVAQGTSRKLMTEIRELTQRLGIQSQTGQIGSSATPDAGGSALMVMSGTDNIGEYKRDLIKAKEETLPALFEKLKDSNNQVARWMSADAVSLEAALNPMKASLKLIDGRIFNITLYAGLTESAAQVREGPAADIHEKLRVMQSRLYMDEECLMQYEAGGMEFENIRQFDDWLARDENFYRLLPFPRCVVAFRVRRYEKARSAETLGQAFINFSKAQADKYTFLYVRNGEQLWWIQTDLDFGPNLFPDQAVYDPLRPVMVTMFADRIDKVMTLDDYETRVEQAKEAKRLHEQWVRDNPVEDYKAAHGGNAWGYRSPYEGGSYQNSWRIPGDSEFRPDAWKSMDPSNVYFDDYMEQKKAEIEQYNRIALIIQGLFDRSMCLHPHMPVQLWNQNSFANAVELVYDGNATLYSGEKPDFQAYFDRLNALIDENSLVIGQEYQWMKREAARENAKAERSLYRRDYRPVELARPHGDPGPGYISRMTEWKKRARKAVFRWTREGPYVRYRGYTTVPCVIEVEARKLFNVSAYKPGDFRQFFLDRRTRHEYLKWAPMLLAAEDFHAGKTSREKGTFDHYTINL